MSVIDDLQAAPHVTRWTKAEYYDAADSGVFRSQPVFLHRGELIEMAAMGGLHAAAITENTECVVLMFSPLHRVRIQFPLELPDQIMPKPDAAVVAHAELSRRPHPAAAVPVIEVNDSSIELDREKAFDYASATVPEYWILNVRDRNLKVCRHPIPDRSTATGFRYSWHQVLKETDAVAPLARPDAAVAVSSLLFR